MTVHDPLSAHTKEHATSRRGFLRFVFGAATVAAGGGVLFPRRLAHAAQSATVTLELFSADGRSKGLVSTPVLVRTPEDWRRQLSAAAFHVTREDGTEYPNSGEYNANHASGIYRCVCCDTALFDSKTKFESGTGWPSFWKPISARNVVESVDNSLFMRRTAVSCRLCDAHLGHVFDDGPRPTGLRYCINSVSLIFRPLTPRASVGASHE